MGMFFMCAESILVIFGGLLGAVLLCVLLWRVMALVHHPELGALVIVALTALAIMVPFTHSPFVRMMLLFSMAGAVPLWLAGREWRAAHKAETTHQPGPGSASHNGETRA